MRHYPDHTADNVEKLAADIVAAWTIGELTKYAEESIANEYFDDRSVFYGAWWNQYNEMETEDGSNNTNRKEDNPRENPESNGESGR